MNNENGFMSVGMGEVRFSSDTGLACYALGSCVACAIYHHQHPLGAVAHIVLPGQAPDANVGPYRYAVDAMAELLRGVKARRIDVKQCNVFLVGGAQVLNLPPLFNGQPIGERNIAAVKAELAKYGIVRYRSELGGKHGRTMRLDIKAGQVSVSRVGHQETVL